MEIECSECKESKPLDAFHNSSSKKHGRMTVCKLCKKAYNAAYRASHKEERALYQKAYNAAHKEEMAARNHNRRIAGGCRLTARNIHYTREQASGFCCWCNKSIKEEHGHIDHIQPVSRGGTNEPGNLVYICDGCNLSKGNMTVLEFMLHRM